MWLTRCVRLPIACACSLLLLSGTRWISCRPLFRRRRSTRFAVWSVASSHLSREWSAVVLVCQLVSIAPLLLVFVFSCVCQMGRFGFDQNLIAQKISTLSGGQRSRVAFALLTWQEPHLIIMDEVRSDTSRHTAQQPAVDVHLRVYTSHLLTHVSIGVCVGALLVYPVCSPRITWIWRRSRR